MCRRRWLSTAFRHVPVCDNTPLPGLLEGTNKVRAGKELCGVKGAVSVGAMVAVPTERPRGLGTWSASDYCMLLGKFLSLSVTYSDSRNGNDNRTYVLGLW